ncbi:MAG: pilin [Patescibacteria group bacterium]
MFKKFSNRWLTNLLMISLGVLILVTTVLASLNLLSVGADSISIPPLGVVYPQKTYQNPNDVPEFSFYLLGGITFLEIYNPDTISGAFGNQTRAYPGYKLQYRVANSSGGASSGSYAIVPLAPFNYLINSDPFYSYKAKDDNPGYLLMQAAAFQFSGENSFRSDLVDSSIRSYEQAIAYSTAEHRIVGDTLYSIAFMITDDSDRDVAISTNHFGQQEIDGSSLAVSIAEGHTYKNPQTDALAQQILIAAKEEADSIGDTASSKKIQTALNNYNQQIRSVTGDEGLTITSLDEIGFGDSAQVNFLADSAKLSIPTDKHLATVLLNIDSTNICTINAESNTISGTGCTLGSNSSSSATAGKFTWDVNTANNLGTDHPEQRTLTLKAFWAPATTGANNLAGSVNKAVAVLEKGGDSSENGSFGISITAPNSLHKEDNRDIITISADLDQIRTAAAAQSPSVQFKYLTWWICNADQTTIINHNDEQGVCFRKGHLSKNSSDDLSSATGTISNTLSWDTRSSSLGPHSVMVKAFGSSEPREYVLNSKTVSDTITVTENEIEGEGDDSGDSDSNGSGGGSVVTPTWAANFRASKTIKTISDLMARIGSFTLVILGILAIIAIIIAGMKYISSGGNSKQSESGKKAILYVIYGIITAVVAVMLVQLTIREVKLIVGQNLSDPTNPNTILPVGFGGTNASIGAIFNQNGFLWRIIQLLVYYAEAAAVFYILYASFLYITSFGEESKAESAKKTLIWAVIGLAFILSANVILKIFAGLVY